MNTIAQLLDMGTQQLGLGDFAPYEARMLLAHTLGCHSATLKANSNNTVSYKDSELYFSLIARRQRNEPLSYILGNKEFYSLLFEVSSDTLVPRTQTELLVKTVLQHLSGSVEILDLGTGCGAIGCTLAHLNPSWKITAMDVCGKALQVAKNNAVRMQLHNIHFIESHWFKALKGKRFDAIISNPPYLRTRDVAIMFGKMPFEPSVALSIGPSGFEAFKIILEESVHHLKPGGLLALEHSFDQADELKALMQRDFMKITVVCDAAGNPRVTFGYLNI